MAQMQLPLAGPNPVDVVRNAQDYLFLASLFPQAGASFNPTTDRVMSERQQADGSTYLTTEFDAQKRTYSEQAGSVWRVLELSGISAVKRMPADRVRVTFKDDQVAWSNTVSPTMIVIGARFVRGLLLGGLQESVMGQADFSRSLASYLGATPGASLTMQDLEARARMFFAATSRGRSEPRTEEDFAEQRRTAVVLLDRLRGTGGDAAVYAELERRLKAAAAGGEISGADGMAIFDVFMRLDSHVRPALDFVLSHELGHVVLGNAPFPPGLSCAEKQRREDDADAFAIALLVYDVPGDMEASAAALYRTKIAEKPNAYDDTLAYGYAHAVRYGFVHAGSNNMITPGCPYRMPEDRIAYMDGLRTKWVAGRAEAFEVAYHYFSAHPPYVYAEQDVDSMSGRQRQTYARELVERCHTADKIRSPRLRKLADLPFGWVVACPNNLDPRFFDSEFVTRLGTATARQLAEEYRRRVPVLLDEDTIRALLSP